MPDDLYDHLPPERAKAVEAWLKTPVGTCRLCELPIYPTDARCLDPDAPSYDAATVVHLSCTAASE